jgi:hypothetical protein
MEGREGVTRVSWISVQLHSRLSHFLLGSCQGGSLLLYCNCNNNNNDDDDDDDDDEQRLLPSPVFSGSREPSKLGAVPCRVARGWNLDGGVRLNWRWVVLN